MLPTDEQIDAAVPPKGSSTADAQQPNRRLTNAILKSLRDSGASAAQTLSEHISDSENPHDVRAAQVGNDSGVAGDSVADALDTLDADKLNAADYNDRWKGLYASLAELQAAHPTANAGDYATVDPGAGSPPRKYLWDTDSAEWVAGSDTAAGSTDELPEGAANLYFTETRVRATSGFNAAVTDGAPAAGDSLDLRLRKLAMRGTLSRVFIDQSFTQVSANSLYIRSAPGTTYNVRLNLGGAWEVGQTAVIANASPSLVNVQPATSGTVLNRVTFEGTYSMRPGEVLTFTLLFSGNPQQWSVTSNLPGSPFNSLTPLAAPANYTLTLGDDTRTVYATGVAAISVPSNALPGYQCAVLRLTDDEVTLPGMSEGPEGPGTYRIKDRGTYAAIELIAVGTWVICGNVELVP